MLQYQGSPWLSHEWSKEKVEFFCDQDAAVDIQRPYISTDFLELCPHAPASDNNAVHPYPDVLALGVMLLEIQTGDTIESQRLPDDLCDGRVNVNTDWFAANRMLKNKKDDMYGDFYSGAIRACLEPSRFQDQCMDEDEFRQALYNSIVIPLEEDLKVAFQISIDHVWRGEDSVSMPVVAEGMAACVL
jgi:hypothetical protein